MTKTNIDYNKIFEFRVSFSFKRQIYIYIFFLLIESSLKIDDVNSPPLYVLYRYLGRQ